jgi:hypothetical protein
LEKTYSSAESHLRGHVDVGNVLVLAQEREMEENSEWGGVGRQHDKLAEKVLVHLDRRTVAIEVGIRQGVCNNSPDTSVQGLGRLVGSVVITRQHTVHGGCNLAASQVAQ